MLVPPKIQLIKSIKLVWSANEDFKCLLVLIIQVTLLSNLDVEFLKDNKQVFPIPGTFSTEMLFLESISYNIHVP